MNFIGIDLAAEAIDFAKKWFDRLQRHHLKERLIVGSITSMPYGSNFFDFVISHGVLE
ncbi:class I SAM-dependent methyltransferase [Calorimonas adulescens]|uniref:Class I SAM-dependent methyltransferase n=1 Tax=Calorimonas adulescens TaxID=2606906 RepID=A0A5D8QBS5_9THEO|nr:class I SAM-dependent methyltransferase [Calorimonas adulescens]TZE82185.1 class I SAM-dependent methyltransferase [Calorimonas adulescens]